MWRSGPLAALHQTAMTELTATRTPVATWRPTTRVATSGWLPGMYLVKLTGGTGAAARASYVPVLVRSPSTAGRTVIMPSMLTWQAYNTFGGRSAYVGPSGFASRSYAVSFDRPNTLGMGTGKFLGYEQPVVLLAERLGLALAYESDIDISTVPGILTGARAVVVLGHAEYWTVAQRDAVEKARDAGTNLVFLGANTSYWRARLSPSGRLMTVYKSARLDPANPAPDTTTLWRLAPHPRAENSLVGQLYNCHPATGVFTVTTPGFWAFRGTGVHVGSTFTGVVANEVDLVSHAGGTPRPLQVVAYSPTTCGGSTFTHSTMTYYTAPSGAGVVSTGSMGWVLDAMVPGRVPVNTYRFVQAVTATILRAVGTGPLGRRFPAADNLNRF